MKLENTDSLGSTHHRYSNAIHFLGHLKDVARQKAVISNAPHKGKRVHPNAEISINTTTNNDGDEKQCLLNEFMKRHSADRYNNWHCGFFSRSKLSKDSTWSDVVDNSNRKSFFYSGNRTRKIINEMKLEGLIEDHYLVLG